MSEAVTEDQPVLDGWTIVLGPSEEDRFPARKTAPEWLLMKYSLAMESKDNAKISAALYKVCLSLVVENERERLDTYLEDHDGAFERLGRALNELTQAWANRPLAAPSTSGLATPTVETQLPQRVVSFEQGTVEIVEQGSADNASTAPASPFVKTTEPSQNFALDQ